MNKQSMERSYIELYHAKNLITHGCEECLAEDIAKNRKAVVTALETALDLMEKTGEVAVRRSKEDNHGNDD